MILVRFVFQIKWGKVQAVLDQVDRTEAVLRRIYGSKVRARVLTDLSGPFNTVVQEVELENLAEWEQIRARLFSDPEFQQAQAGMEGLYEAGRTEFYTIEKTYEPQV